MKEAKLIIFGVMISSILYSCENDLVAPKDYREPYIGNFQFTNSIKQKMTDTTYKDTIVNYLGTVSYGEHDTEVNIIFHPNYGALFILEKDGGLLKPYYAGLGWGGGGRFETKDSVVFSFTEGIGLNFIEDEVTGIRK